MTIAVKIYNSYRIVVALCDSNLIGKKFEEGKRQLHLRENFYKEREVTKEEAIKIIKQEILNDATFNIVGENAVSAAISSGLIEKSSTDSIGGIPFALTLL